MASEEQLITRLKALLQEVDLQTTTEKMIRKTLEAEFGCDLSEKKQLIRSEVEAYLAETAENGEEEEEEDDESEDEAPKSRGTGFGSCVLSPALQEFLGEESMPRTQIVKQLWAYIKSNNLQDPKDKRNILLDDKLKTLFTSPLTAFSINKQLTRHVKSAGETSGGGPRPRPAAKRPAASSAGSSKKAKGSDGEVKKNGFTKPVKVSEELAAFVGSDSISRPELTKFFWAYFREHNLKDPKDGRMIICDAKLKGIMRVDKFQAFGFMKHLNHHIVKD